MGGVGLARVLEWIGSPKGKDGRIELARNGGRVELSGLGKFERIGEFGRDERGFMDSGKFAVEGNWGNCGGWRAEFCGEGMSGIVDGICLAGT